MHFCELFEIPTYAWISKFLCNKISLSLILFPPNFVGLHNDDIIYVDSGNIIDHQQKLVIININVFNERNRNCQNVIIERNTSIKI